MSEINLNLNLTDLNWVGFEFKKQIILINF